jgi:hypothetical protein
MTKITQNIRKIKDLDTPEYEEVKRLYMEYHSVKSIAEQFNIGRTSLSYHANKHWKLERDMVKADLFSQFSDSKKANFIKMSQAAIQIMTRALESQASADRPPTLREAKDATVVLEALDKITRLDEGNPTDITAEKAVSFKDIEAVASLNPFKSKEIEDAEFKEGNEDSDDGSDVRDTTDSH